MDIGWGRDGEIRTVVPYTSLTWFWTKILCIMNKLNSLFECLRLYTWYIFLDLAYKRRWSLWYISGIWWMHQLWIAIQKLSVMAWSHLNLSLWIVNNNVMYGRTGLSRGGGAVAQPVKLMQWTYIPLYRTRVILHLFDGDWILFKIGATSMRKEFISRWSTTLIRSSIPFALYSVIPTFHCFKIQLATSSNIAYTTLTATQ